MKHWRIEDVAWDRFDPEKVDPAVIPLVKAAAMVERNGTDYAVYLNAVFRDDPDFRRAVDAWSVEEVQHGDALGRWATLADPGWDYLAAFGRFREGYRLNLDVGGSIRGSRTGELIARCMVETGTSSYYTALADSTEEPVLQQICRLIAADEYRHFKLFYDHMRRYLARERISVSRAASASPPGESGKARTTNWPTPITAPTRPGGTSYDRGRCIAAYMAQAMAFYRFRHIERATGMILKSVGLPPRGRFSDLSARLAWRFVQRRRKRLLGRVESSIIFTQAA
ncbi:MAG: ferritin-like domain-containing protein [Thermomicrobiales bacterium]